MIEKYELYKLDSKGKLRVLYIWPEGSEVVQESGLIDGKLSIRRSQCIGKNIGKNNETTPVQQAMNEATAKFTKKIKEGYFNTPEDAKSEVVILPTLAHEYSKHASKVTFPCYVQPKLDGMRCLGKSNEMKSRKNTAIETMPHILTELNLMDLGFYLDGELYEHGKSFQENMKLIKKYRGKDSEKVKYHVYDLISKTLPFKERYGLLELYVAARWNIELVPTYVVNNEDDIKKYHSQFLSEGYEGTIIRWGEEGYPINKRSQYLLKYKDFIDISCPVVDIIPSEKQPTHGVAVCELLSGDTFKCGMKFSHKDREEILLEKDYYIKKYRAEIRFFEYTDAGLPRFPVCVGFRLDK